MPPPAHDASRPHSPRSTSVTRWPASANCSVVIRPMMPPPTTRKSRTIDSAFAYNVIAPDRRECNDRNMDITPRTGMRPYTTRGYTKPATKRKAVGFTLIELLVVIALVVIMTTWAVPSFQSLIERSRIATEVMRLRTALAQARNTAVTRRVPITVCPSLNQKDCVQDWKAPLMLFVNKGTAGERNIVSEPVLKTWPASEAGSVAYSGFGSERYIRYRPNGAPKGQNGTYTICRSSQPTGVDIILSAYGRARSTASSRCER